MSQMKKYLKFKKCLNFKIVQNSENVSNSKDVSNSEMSPKLQNDHYSKMTQIKKWTKLKTDPNWKMTQI